MLFTGAPIDEANVFAAMVNNILTATHGGSAMPSGT
jgi:hypothetical protein